MAKRLFEQPTITLNTLDVGADVYSAEIMTSRRSAVQVTGLSDTYEQFLVPNLRGWSVKLNYYNNHTGTSASPQGISTVLNGVYLSSQTSGVTLTVRQTSGNRGPTNPEFTGQVQIDGDFSPMSGDVATADKGSVTLRGLSTLSWFTSSS